MEEVLGFLLSLPLIVKLFVLFLVDFIAFTIALWSAFALRFSDWWPLIMVNEAKLLFLLTPPLSILVMWSRGLYRAVNRYLDLAGLKSIGSGMLLVCCLTYSLIMVIPIQTIPRSIPLIFALCAFAYVGGSRIFIGTIFKKLNAKQSTVERIIIFGAGSAGVQFAQLCKAGSDYFPVAFVDDDQALWNREVSGLRVHSPKQLPKLVKSYKAETIVLALPSASEQARKRIINEAADVVVEIKTMPTLNEIMAGEPLNKIREVTTEGLLGRDTVKPEMTLLEKNVKGKNVCITGAGGSIGSELARQVLEFGAARILLYEQSEFSLYNIDCELTEKVQMSSLKAEVVPLLGSVLDRQRLTQALLAFEIHTIYHAAAYKHVPIVEHNITQGVKNNTLGTEAVALAAEESGVERFILVSTDKAVRPTNVMGASKRMAELLLQDLASRPNAKVVFSMVRFGNVLESSGSVVPIFRKQLKERKRLTVTHPEVTRYFMTISEAATLVIQAGSLAEGGEVFVLDMGEPVKILDLAKNMIEQSGLKIRNEEFPDGDIEVEFTGLRPGEKLYEELLVGADVKSTTHPKIFCAVEERLPGAKLRRALKGLRNAVESSNPHQIRGILAHVVAGYDASEEDVDWLIDAPRVVPSGGTPRTSKYGKEQNFFDC